MKPENRSKILLGITRSKAKMFEFDVPLDHHIAPSRNPSGLFSLTIAILGDVAAGIARGGDVTEVLVRAKQELRFAAFFFDAYRNGDNDHSLDPFLTLLASAAYYLCDLPGSATVLIGKATQGKSECRDLDQMLTWLLRGRTQATIELQEHCYAGHIIRAGNRLNNYYLGKDTGEEALGELRSIREKAYRCGTPRELLLSDIIMAVAKRRLEFSARACLPLYTGIPVEKWENVLARSNFLKEFWPAQRLLGDNGVFRGKSAVVQMPTSAGKTRATEILIRSSILSGRSNFAVIVAPFRALCHEIRDSLVGAFEDEEILINDISDVPQRDFDFESTEKPQILILTPEKLLYLTRQVSDLAPRIKLLIYDEGHQFDTGPRGVTYELLVSVLKRVIAQDSQVVLLSAVIANASAINEWLNGDQGTTVSGAHLLPNQRSVAFASWQDTLGQLQFIAQPDSGSHTFFVPRVLERTALNKLGRERNIRFFPERNQNDIALYLGLKVVSQGSVAIFCGKKAQVTKLCGILSSLALRGADITIPAQLPQLAAAQEEIAKLTDLIIAHYGPDGPIPHCAKLGVFTHHGTTPPGIRLSVEHAMKESLIRMVFCTSTLAQGVNLPIRYLIITGVYLGASRIKVRDFQNLIGRAGRSGMHTEGSIIFSNPETFDSQNNDGGDWRWQQVEELLDPERSEACASSLLEIFEAFYNDAQDDATKMDVHAFLEALYSTDEGAQTFVKSVGKELRGLKTSLHKQVSAKVKTVAALESFMMAASGESDDEINPEAAATLARGTLAFHLAEPSQRDELEWLFKEIASHVIRSVPEPTSRKAYARSMFGVRTSLKIHEWTRKKTESLILAEGELASLLETLWPVLELGIENALFKKCTDSKSLQVVAKLWMEADPYWSLLDHLRKHDVRFGSGEKPAKPTIDHVIEICENAFAFEGVLVISAIVESLRLDGLEEHPVVEQLSLLQKRLKYGLRDQTSILITEIGFADRVVADKLAAFLGRDISTKSQLRRSLRANHSAVSELLAKFPSYYTFVWQNILATDWN